MLDEPPRAGEAQVTANWLGTAGVLISDGKTKILIDSFVSRKGLGFGSILRSAPIDSDPTVVQHWAERIGARDTNVIIVTHSHYDHSLDAERFHAMTDGRAWLLGSPSKALIFGGAEGPVKLAQTNIVYEIGHFKISFRPSAHSPLVLGLDFAPGLIERQSALPSPAGDLRAGQVYAVVLRHRFAGTLLHLGTADWLENTFTCVQTDVALLTLAGRGDTKRYIAQANQGVGAHMVIPIHFDNFFGPLEENRLRCCPGRNSVNSSAWRARSFRTSPCERCQWAARWWCYRCQTE